MHKLYSLKDKLIRKLEDYDDNDDISRSNAEEIKMLSSAADHICNICRDAEEMEEYSSRAYPDGMGGSYRRGRGGSYRGGSSNDGGIYARGRGRYRDEYSRDGGYPYRDGEYMR